MSDRQRRNVEAKDTRLPSSVAWIVLQQLNRDYPVQKASVYRHYLLYNEMRLFRHIDVTELESCIQVVLGMEHPESWDDWPIKGPTADLFDPVRSPVLLRALLARQVASYVELEALWQWMAACFICIPEHASLVVPILEDFFRTTLDAGLYKSREGWGIAKFVPDVPLFFWLETRSSNDPDWMYENGLRNLLVRSSLGVLETYKKCFMHRMSAQKIWWTLRCATGICGKKHGGSRGYCGLQLAMDDQRRDYLLDWSASIGPETVMYRMFDPETGQCRSATLLRFVERHRQTDLPCHP